MRHLGKHAIVIEGRRGLTRALAAPLSATPTQVATTDSHPEVLHNVALPVIPLFWVGMADASPVLDLAENRITKGRL